VRLVALVESPDHVCCRYRLAAFRPHLAAAGHALDLAPLPRGWLGRLRLFRILRDADAVILQRKLLPPLQLAVLRRFARRLVFDFDDAVWLRDSYHPRGLTSRLRAGRFRRTAAAADVVAAGNAFLADAARSAGAGRVGVVPTCVDPAAYPVAAHAGAGGLRLVWVGSSSTLRGLDRIRDFLAAVGRAVPGARVKLVCDRFLRFDPLPVDPVRWDAATEAREIADADAGIAWVPDDDWSRGKCGLKVLQYQAAGLPVIANPVGMHRELVRDGETGFLASTAAEWVAAASRLAGDPGLRRRMGHAARAQVGAAYGVAVGGRAWVDLVAGLAGGGGARLRRSG
jgi:glycosyltransferase involved in cell wall biosynthesis